MSVRNEILNEILSGYGGTKHESIRNKILEQIIVSSGGDYVEDSSRNDLLIKWFDSLTPQDFTYLVDENGDFLADENGALLVDDGDKFWNYDATYLVKNPYLIMSGADIVVLAQSADYYARLDYGKTTAYGTSVSMQAYADNVLRHKITGLDEGDTYYYRLVIGFSEFLGTFKAPVMSGASEFYIMGDTRTEFVDTNIIAGQIMDDGINSFALHCGDWNSLGQEADWADEWFNKDFPLLNNFLTKYPVHGVMGNHDIPFSIYNKYYPYDYVNAGSAYYVLHYGNADVFIMDTETDISTGSTQNDWLLDAVASSVATHKIFFSHKPCYSAGAHANEQVLIDDVLPIATANGVQLWLCGHNHYYAHVLTDGIHFLTVGSSGAPTYAPDMNTPDLVTGSEKKHFAKVTIDTNINIIVTAQDGENLDTILI